MYKQSLNQHLVLKQEIRKIANKKSAIQRKCGVLHLEACVAPRRGGSDITLEPPPLPVRGRAADGGGRLSSPHATGGGGPPFVSRDGISGQSLRRP
jgi:hypothetical protein